MKQGDNVLIWGASGGLGGFATQYALNGGANPVCVVSNEEKAAHRPQHGRGADHQPLRGGLQVLERRGHPAGPEGVEALRREDPRAHRRRGHRHRLRAPGPRDLRRLGLRHPQGRHHHHLRVDLGLHARVRQPLPVDEPQADHLQPLRQLPRVVGGQPPHRQGQDPPDPVADLHASRTSARPRSTSTRTPTRARSASSAWPPRRASASATRRCAPSTSTRSTASAASDAARPPPVGAHPGSRSIREPGCFCFPASARLGLPQSAQT